MEKQFIRVAFSRSNLPFSVGIRIYDAINNRYLVKGFELPPFSHAGLVIDDIVIESTWSHGGVKVATLETFKSRATCWCIVDIEVKDKEAAIKAIRAQLGKPYDKTAIFGLLVNDRDFEEDDSWFCSELIVFGLHAGGTYYFNKNIHNSVTPGMLFSVPHRYVDASANFLYS